MVIERAETPVMFKRVADEASAISHAMQDVQEAVGLRGRKYYGAFDTTASTASASSFATMTTRRRRSGNSPPHPSGHARDAAKPRSVAG